MPVLTPGVPVESADGLFVVDGLAPGTHRFTLVVEDEHGNRSLPDTARVIVRPPLPVVSGIVTGWGDWGAAVTVNGSNFDPDPAKNTVTFSSGLAVPGLPFSTSPVPSTTQLRVRVPQPAVTGPVTVTTPQGSATAPRPFIVPRGFSMQAPAAPLIDLAAEPLRNEVWVLHGQTGSDLGAVSMMSLERRGTVSTLAVQQNPREIAVSDKDLAMAAVSNFASSTVTIIDVRNRKPVVHLKVSPNPGGLAFQPGGRILYVACSAVAASAAQHFVDVILFDASLPPRVLTRIAMQPGPARVVFSPDGKLAFVTEVGSGTVAMIDAGAHRLVRRFKVGGASSSAPAEVAVSATTFPLLVACAGGRAASVVDASGNVTDLDLGLPTQAAAIDGRLGWLATAAEALLIPVDLSVPRPRKLAVPGPGSGPKTLVVQPGRGLLASLPTTNAVAVADAGGRVLQAVAAQPDRPQRGVLSADGAWAVWLGTRTPTVCCVETASVLP